LIDNSYLSKIHGFDPHKFHADKEQELKTAYTFAQLWPKLADQI